MPILQQYYTSCENEATGVPGFQVKVTSPGVSAEQQKTINSLVNYEIPASLGARAIETHPISLRYLYCNPNECIFLCSQSIGSDDNGRPGNYFAHTLVMEPSMFEHGFPILYWKSPFWQRADPETRTQQTNSLPILNTFHELPSLDPTEGMWAFLAQGKRRELLYKLLCAVVHHHKTEKRIVILDSTENVVWWITIVSLLLPPEYRQFLSFATYFHNPLYAPFLIIGTTRDWFRDAANNSQAFFVLDAEQGQYSAIEDSPYAQAIVAVAQPELLETELQPLLSDYTGRFPLPTTIDQQLDLMMLYTNIQKGRNADTLSKDELQAIHLALDSFDKLSSLTAEDSGELTRLQDVLALAFSFKPSPEIATAQSRVEVLLKQQQAKDTEHLQVAQRQQEEALRQAELEEQREQQLIQAQEEERQQQARLLEQQRQQAEREHHLVHNQAVVQNGPGYPQAQSAIPVHSDPGLSPTPPQTPPQNGQVTPSAMTNEEMAELLKQEEARNKEFSQTQRRDRLQAFIRALDNERDEVQAHFDQLCKDYNNDLKLLAEDLNQPLMLQELEQTCKMATTRFFTNFWHFLGRYLALEPQSLDIMIPSLYEVSRLVKRERDEESGTLFNAIFSAMEGQEQEWLLLIVKNAAKLADDMVFNVYYKCVEALELDARKPFRNIMHLLYKNDMLGLLKRELMDDVSFAEFQRGPEVIEDWMRHAKEHNYDAGVLMDAGLHRLKEKCSQQQWRELAPRILSSKEMDPLTENIEYELARMVLPILSLAQYKPADVVLCARYYNYDGLSEDTRTTLSAILAMVNSTMDQALAQRIQRQVKILLPYEYEPGVKRFIPEFFQHDVAPDAHNFMIAAFFTREFGYDVYFWQAYETTFKQVFLSLATTQRAVAMLGFWFARVPEHFIQPYVVQEFFLNLPVILDSLPQAEGFGVAVRGFHTGASKEKWYPIVQGYLPKQNGLLAQAQQWGGQAMQFMQGLGKGRDEQAIHRQIAQKVAALFERKSEIKNHRTLLKEEPMLKVPCTEFWLYYWKSFETLALYDAGLTLDLLAFWFDESFATLSTSYYVPQQFFLGLRQALQKLPLSNPQMFQNIAKQVNAQVAQQKKELYLWFPLVKQYFEQPEQQQ